MHVSGTAWAGVSKTMELIQQARTGSATTYGETQYQNRGPFRLFFPVNPAARALSYLNASAGDNVPYQHLAQGYNLSGQVSASNDLSTLYPDLINSITSSMTIDAEARQFGIWHNTIGKVTGGAYGYQAVAMSGYYFQTEFPIFSVSAGNFSGTPYITKAMLPNSDPTNIMLDESFSNTFNNAKHCSTSYSGRKKLVTIYRAKTSYAGEPYPGGSGAWRKGLGNGFTSTNIFDVERDM